MKMAESVQQIEDPDLRELEAIQLQVEQAIMSISFFTGYSVESLKASEFLDKVVSIYNESMARVINEESKIPDNLQLMHIWNQEEWEIQSPELKYGDKMQFGEFIDSKQIIQNMIGLSKNRWECLVPLCAIFLRKKGEEHQKEHIFEESERQKLMRTLPLDIALHVGFFLTNSLLLYTEVFQFSQNPELSPAEGT